MKRQRETGLIAGAGLAGLFAWWRRQIETLLPGLAPRLFAGRDAVIIEVWSVAEDVNAARPATGQILARKSGRIRIVAPLDFTRQAARAASETVVLRLPEPLVLRREVTLAPAAERDLRALVHSQLDRLTPFDAAEIFWAVSRPRREANRVTFMLHLAARRRLALLLERLASIGLAPTVLEDGAHGIRLAQFGQPKRAWRAARLGLAAALALGCLLVPLISQERRLRANEHRLEMLLPAQRQIAALQAQIAGQSAVQSLLSQAPPGVAQRLALLSAALPDGTWLTDLSMRGDQATLDGQSSDAARLILALTAMPGLRDAGFIAPVTRGPGGLDVFSIQLSFAR